MSQIIRLRGRAALSSFRLQKLKNALSPTLPRARIAAEFWHFATVTGALDAAETKRLGCLLTYGPKAAAPDERGTLFLVVPRLGTISPWSSTATEIARHCGLEAIERIERGVAYWIEHEDGAALSEADAKALLPHIHDRMTETVFDSMEDAGKLFMHHEP